MTIDEMSKDIARMGVRLEQERRRASGRIGNRLVRAFKQNFLEESFFGEPWEDVKRRTNPTKRQARSSDSRRKILTGRTGNLRRSVQMEQTGDGVVIYSDLNYSAAHNDGTTSAGRGHKTRIPQRRFIGEHAEVHRIIREELDKLTIDK